MIMDDYIFTYTMKDDNFTYIMKDYELTFKVSNIFINEIIYICDFVVLYYEINEIIFTDILDILCHDGYELGSNVTDNFENDGLWFKSNGINYIFTYITSKIQLTEQSKIDDIYTLISGIILLYQIQHDNLNSTTFRRTDLITDGERWKVYMKYNVH
jgi:hypothetical protein